MKRFVLAALALLVAGACARNSESQLGATLDEARQALRRGDFSQAQGLAERGLAASPPESVWAWTFRLYRGEVLLQRQQPAEVLPLSTVPIPAGAAFDPVRARQKYLSALLQLSRNNLPGTLQALTEARQLAPDGSDLQLEIELLEGQAKLRMGQWAAAEQALNAAVAKAAARRDDFSQARGWNDLGMGGLVRGRWDEAILKFEHVLSLPDLGQMTIYAGASNNAGVCYARLGELDRALSLQQKAIAFYAGHGRRLDYAAALGELGNTYVQRGEPARGLTFYQQALAVAKDTNLPTAATAAALWAGNLAGAEIDLAQWDEAERFNEEARRLKALSHSSAVHNTLNAAQIARGRGRFDEAAHLFNEALDDPTVDLEVRWGAHAGLGDIAVAQSKPADARRHFEAALDSIEKTRAELIKTEFKVTFLTRLIRFYQSYIDALVDQGDIDRALEIADSSRGRVLANRTNWPAPPKASAASLRQVAANSHAVLLSYWLGRTRSYLWVVAADGVHLVRLPPSSEIAAVVREYKDGIDNALGDPLATAGGAGDKLYGLLIAPAAAWLPAGTRAIVVADGALHSLNFETLPVPGAK